jgi:hypothetical protein
LGPRLSSENTCDPASLASSPTADHNVPARREETSS